jgi:hypothetical protein
MFHGWAPLEMTLKTMAFFGHKAQPYPVPRLRSQLGTFDPACIHPGDLLNDGLWAVEAHPGDDT